VPKGGDTVRGVMSLTRATDGHPLTHETILARLTSSAIRGETSADDWRQSPMKAMPAVEV